MKPHRSYSSAFDAVSRPKPIRDPWQERENAVAIISFAAGSFFTVVIVAALWAVF